MLTDADLEKIRAIVKEEVKEALAPLLAGASRQAKREGITFEERLEVRRLARLARTDPDAYREYCRNMEKEQMAEKTARGKGEGV